METTGYFEEEAGKKSYVRLVGFILLCADLLIMLWHEIKHKDSMGNDAYSDNYCYFQIVILSFVFFPKVMQKIVEAVMQIKLGQKTDAPATVTTTATATITQP